MKKFEMIIKSYGKTLKDFEQWCKENKKSMYSIETKKEYIKLLLKEK